MSLNNGGWEVGGGTCGLCTFLSGGKDACHQAGGVGRPTEEVSSGPLLTSIQAAFGTQRASRAETAACPSRGLREPPFGQSGFSAASYCQWPGWGPEEGFTSPPSCPPSHCPAPRPVSPSFSLSSPLSLSLLARIRPQVGEPILSGHVPPVSPRGPELRVRACEASQDEKAFQVPSVVINNVSGL